MKRALAIGLALVLAACGTARTLVLDPVRSAGRFTRVELVENNPTVRVPAEITATFRSVIE